ncbi:nucleoside hydrolase [Jannaschia formosa]|uniref:nucleoside hydrolase n=1 Tax=Jannaschia formosa TaxID=2259592 RepID=UPI000E1B6857|nr:nucleoside hydrolase [Jannaschia formosa]TFL18074.1 nucleoside hydrolase [Jannaschia formosa]
MTGRAPLILDTDGGVDDAQALLLLLAAGVAPEAVTTVFGNVPLPAATRNILSVLAVAGAEVPVHAGQAAPLLAAPVHAREIHGEDGLGGAPRPAAQGEPAGEDAVGFLVARLRRAAEEQRPVDLLAIGPLTNLAMVLRLAPDAGQGIGRLIVMGGTRHGRGNITPAAEFNVFADPEAAAIVVRALPVVLVPWEVCVAHVLPGPEVEAIFADRPETGRTRFTRALADHARRTVQHYGGPDVLRFVDPLAAAVAVDPEVATETETASLDVVLAEGPARGMMLTDPTGRLGTPRATVVVRAGMARLREMFAASC